MKKQHVKEDVILQQIHVIAKLHPLENVEMDQLQEQLLAEIKKLKIVLKDVILNQLHQFNQPLQFKHQQILVIV
jgi:acyl-ACP thioesterase